MSSCLLESEATTNKKLKLVDPIDEEWLLKNIAGPVTHSNVHSLYLTLSTLCPPGVSLNVGIIVEIGLSSLKNLEEKKISKPVAIRLQDFAREYVKPLTYISFEEFNEIVEDISIEPFFCHKDPQLQSKLFKEFNNQTYEWILSKSPYYETVDFIFQDSLSGEEHPVAKKLRNAFVDGDNLVLLLGVSGAGKTNGIAEFSKQNWIIYFLCSSLGALNPFQIIDDGYISIVKEYEEEVGKIKFEYRPNTFTSSLYTREELFRIQYEPYIKIAQRISKVEFVCRLAQLWKLLNRFPNMTPFDYFVHQKNYGDIWISELRLIIKNLSEDCCINLVEEMRKRIEKELFVVFDQIDVGFKIHRGHFDDINQKGFLSPQISAVESMREVGKFKMIFVGTGIEQEFVEETIQIEIGKEKPLRSLFSYNDTLFPRVNIEACRNFFGKRLNVSDVLNVCEIGNEMFLCKDPYELFTKMEELDKIDPLDENFALKVITTFILNSRYGILTRIVQNLCRIVNAEELPDCFKSKAQKLNYVVSKSVLDIIYDLQRAFDYVLDNRRYAPSRSFISFFLSVETSVRLWQGKTQFLPSDKIEEHFKSLSIGNFVQDNGKYEINEPIVMMALVVYFKENEQLLSSYKA